MNCKPGELCFVANMDRTPEANGHFVTTVRLIESGHVLPDGSVFMKYEDSPAWLVVGHNIPMRDFAGDLSFVSQRGIWDRNLRPARPGDITDEEVRDLYAPKVPEHA